MPQLLGLVLFGAAAVAGYKSLQRAIGRASGRATGHGDGVQNDPDKAGQQAVMKDLGALELDEQTGVYKPRA